MGYRMDPDEFINWLYPVAQNVCANYGLPAAVVTSQGALESGWNEYTIGNFNLFGRKWGGWGNYIEVPTQECYNDEWVTIIAKFQDYDSLEQAIEDWCVLMTQETVYVNALQDVDVSDPFAFINAVGPVYATDPVYCDKVISTMRACNLV